MAANVMVIVERQFDYPQSVVFDAWTDPEQLGAWRGSPGWHVDPDTNTAELRLGGRHHHDKVVDLDAGDRVVGWEPGDRVGTDGVYTEWYPPHVFVSRERISGDPGINPAQPLELRVELIKMGRNGTMVRIVQGPYEPSESEFHSQGWEFELARLDAFLTHHSVQEIAR